MNESTYNIARGDHFGSWTVVRYVDNGYWSCRCRCGVERRVCGSSLRKGRSQSCGSAKCSPGRQIVSLAFKSQEEGLRAQEIERLIKLCRLNGLSGDDTVDIVYHRFGALSQREIGDAMGMSRQRVQQIECRALEKLRKCPEASELLKEMVNA